jgi:hypothetical protein
VLTSDNQNSWLTGTLVGWVCDLDQWEIKASVGLAYA